MGWFRELRRVTSRMGITAPPKNSRPGTDQACWICMDRDPPNSGWVVGTGNGSPIAVVVCGRCAEHLLKEGHPEWPHPNSWTRITQEEALDLRVCRDVMES